VAVIFACILLRVGTEKACRGERGGAEGRQRGGKWNEIYRLFTPRSTARARAHTCHHPPYVPRSPPILVILTKIHHGRTALLLNLSVCLVKQKRRDNHLDPPRCTSKLHILVYLTKIPDDRQSMIDDVGVLPMGLDRIHSSFH
jgi:hypothetical protein